VSSGAVASVAALIVCIEGPSAVGKTTLTAALAEATGAAVVPELDAGAAPPIAESAVWFVDHHASLWRRARALAADAPLVVLDGDPFKGLWYNRVYAADGWPGVDAVAPLYRARIREGALAFPDLYVALEADEATLRARRSGDATRRRRGFEKHLALVEPLRRWFAALAGHAPALVLRLETAGRSPDELAAAVRDALERADGHAVDSLQLLDRMTEWVRAQGSARAPGS
jgi:thymidylate kinase